MKRLIVFTLLLLSSFPLNLNACGFYPWGEEVRFCYLKPKYFGYDAGYSYFNYTTDWYDYSAGRDTADGEYDFSFYIGSNYTDPNLSLWQQYCNGKVDKAAIEEAVYKLPAKSVNRNSGNAMLRYLYRTRNTEAIDYILFAKACEKHTWNEDPWEVNENKDTESLAHLIDEAGKRAETIKDGQLKRRYLFLKVRLLYYFGKDKDLIAVYDKHFKNASQKDLIYYWVLFFYTQCQHDPVVQNYYAAQVFANTPDKRFIVRSNYDRTIPVEETLALAKTPEEKANIWLLDGVRDTGKGLPYIKNIYANNPMAPGFGFLLLREMNKMEDWILTPQYSLFEPTTRTDFWENDNARRILNRVKEDRKYAKEVMDFLNTVDVMKTDNPGLVLLAKAYTAFLAKENIQAVTALQNAENAIGKNDKLRVPLQLVKGMVLVASQPDGRAVIPDAVKPILLEQFKKGNHKYIFGIGRELEEKGNSTLAALLFSKSVEQKEIYEYESWLQTAYWKSKNNISTLNSDYYEEYLSYIDAGYTIPEMQALINDVNAFKGKDAFSKWLYSEAVGDRDELYSILGTKYFREGKLKEASEVFHNINPGYDYAWAENIFYKVNFTPEFTPDYNKKQKVTRAYITDNLIKVLAKANDAGEKDRDYYCFLAANCYYNLGYYGSAWDMTRRFRSANIENTGLPDDTDYFGAAKALKYYTLAYNNAKTPKFKALCLRMMLQCENHRLYYDYESNGWRYNNRYGVKVGPNKYDSQLKKEYGQYYNELTSNCTAFKDYFAAR